MHWNFVGLLLLCGIESSLGGCLPPRSAVARPSIPDDPTGNYVLVNAKFGAPARAFDHEQGYPVVVKSTGGNAVWNISALGPNDPRRTLQNIGTSNFATLPENDTVVITAAAPTTFFVELQDEDENHEQRFLISFNRAFPAMVWAAEPAVNGSSEVKLRSQQGPGNLEQLWYLRSK